MGTKLCMAAELPAQHEELVLANHVDQGLGLSDQQFDYVRVEARLKKSGLNILWTFSVGLVGDFENRVGKYCHRDKIKSKSGQKLFCFSNKTENFISVEV